MLRLPLHITDDRLLGGLALAATLRAGRVVSERGVLAAADGGVVVAAMAERLEPNVTSHLCQALDRGELALERDGMTATLPCRFGVLALDEGIDEERLSAPLRDRLALSIDLTAAGHRVPGGLTPDGARVSRARTLLSSVAASDETADALCRAAQTLGIDSLRAPILAVTVARVHAALHGRFVVEEADAAVAARLVLGPRATRLPAPPQEREENNTPQDESPGEPSPAPHHELPSDEQNLATDPLVDARPPLEDIVLEAAKSAIPQGVLDALVLGLAPRGPAGKAGQAGARKMSTMGGRPAGVRPGQPNGGQRLNVIETLRAAAPWQPLRRKERGDLRKIDIRKDDFRVTRFKQRSETSVIFSVDASGSAAMQRLAEAKGAVEQVLADCYVRRDHVALIAFRGSESAIVLPPTRSLVRVRKSLAELAGGGPTPLAAGIDSAVQLALESRKRGHTPVIVVMTDGRGNVARDGRQGREEAMVDATNSARALRAAGVLALFLDTSARPQPAAQKLAAEMGARYLPLPYLDAAGISRQVQSLTGQARAGQPA